MELVFELSGKYPELAIAEIKALFETYGLSINGKTIHSKLLRIKTDEISKERIQDVFSRLGLVHGIYILKIVSKKIKNIFSYSKNINVKKTYCIRAKRIKKSLNDKNLMDLEKNIGEKIGGKVDLENPEKLFKLFLSDELLFLTEKIFEINRSTYRKRKPHKRNFFKPGAIEPELARAVINLARAREGYLLDIFSGTGSFLIEATEMEIPSIGLDASKEMLMGSKKNFFEKKPKKFDLVQGDAKKLPFKENFFESTVADPPYGRSSKIIGDNTLFYQKTIKEAIQKIKKGGHLCFISPQKHIDLKLNINEIERYKVKEHGSLTRIIRVFRR